MVMYAQAKHLCAAGLKLYGWDVAPYARYGRLLDGVGAVRGRRVGDRAGAVAAERLSAGGVVGRRGADVRRVRGGERLPGLRRAGDVRLLRRGCGRVRGWPSASISRPWRCSPWGGLTPAPRCAIAPLMVSQNASADSGSCVAACSQACSAACGSDPTCYADRNATRPASCCASECNGDSSCQTACCEKQCMTDQTCLSTCKAAALSSKCPPPVSKLCEGNDKSRGCLNNRCVQEGVKEPKVCDCLWDDTKTPKCWCPK